MRVPPGGHPKVSRARRAVGRGLFGVWITVSLSVLVLSVPAWAQADPLMLANTPDRAWATLGAPIFEANCKPCHGPEGKGDGPVMADQEHAMIDFTDPAQLGDRSPSQWVDITRTGRIEALMPPWENQLTPEEIWDVVAYLWQLSTIEEDLVQGAALWQSLTDLADPIPDTTTWAHRALALTPADWRATFPGDFGLLVTRELTTAELDSLQRYLQSLVLTPTWAPSLRAGSTGLTGQVRPRSPGQTLPPHLPIRLTAAAGSAILQELHAEGDAQGRFVFPKLDPSSRLAYQVHVQLEDLAFASSPTVLSPDAAAHEVQLDVFRPASSGDALEVQRMHVILSVSSEQILVGQTAWLVNAAPYVFTGTFDAAASHPVTARIPLPPGATDLTVAEAAESRFTRAGNALLDSQPIYPVPTGQWATLGYSLPLPLVRDAWIQEWAYPLQDVTVRISDLPGMTVRLPGFAPAGQEALGGQSFSIWQAASLPEGRLAVHFDGLPTMARLTYQMPLWMPWAVAGFLLALIATSVWRFRKPSPLGPGPDLIA